MISLIGNFLLFSALLTVFYTNFFGVGQWLRDGLMLENINFEKVIGKESTALNITGYMKKSNKMMYKSYNYEFNDLTPQDCKKVMGDEFKYDMNTGNLLEYTRGELEMWDYKSSPIDTEGKTMLSANWPQDDKLQEYISGDDIKKGYFLYHKNYDTNLYELNQTGVNLTGNLNISPNNAKYKQFSIRIGTGDEEMHISRDTLHHEGAGFSYSGKADNILITPQSKGRTVIADGEEKKLEKNRYMIQKYTGDSQMQVHIYNTHNGGESSPGRGGGAKAMGKWWIEVEGQKVAVSTNNTHEGYTDKDLEFSYCNGRTPQPINPILECVSKKDNGDYVAKFGYKNYNNCTAEINVGENNKFDPIANEQGQTTQFYPGRWYNDFEVSFSGDKHINWILQNNNVIADSSSQKCEIEITEVGYEPIGYVFINEQGELVVSELDNKNTTNLSNNNVESLVENTVNYYDKATYGAKKPQQEDLLAKEYMNSCKPSGYDERGIIDIRYNKIYKLIR